MHIIDTDRQTSELYKVCMQEVFPTTFHLDTLRFRELYEREKKVIFCDKKFRNLKQKERMFYIFLGLCWLQFYLSHKGLLGDSQKDETH